MATEQTSVHKILTTQLHMKKICAKLVPKHLTVDQKEKQLGIFQDVLKRLRLGPKFLDKIIMGSETSF